MQYTYDDQNIFAKILRSEIPCQKIYESEHTLAFSDIAPKTPHHVLVIPKGPYICYDHFARAASDAEILDYTRSIGTICAELGVAPGDGGSGYRMIANAGPDGVQEVPHLHVHILAGRNIGPMVMMRP